MKLFYYLNGHIFGANHPDFIAKNISPSIVANEDFLSFEEIGQAGYDYIKKLSDSYYKVTKESLWKNSFRKDKLLPYLEPSPRHQEESTLFNDFWEGLKLFTGKEIKSFYNDEKRFCRVIPNESQFKIEDGKIAPITVWPSDKEALDMWVEEPFLCGDKISLYKNDFGMIIYDNLVKKNRSDVCSDKFLEILALTGGNFEAASYYYNLPMIVNCVGYFSGLDSDVGNKESEALIMRGISSGTSRIDWDLNSMIEGSSLDKIKVIDLAERV